MRREENETTRKTFEEVDFPKQFKLYEQGSMEVACKRSQHTPNILGEACERPPRVKEVNLGNGVDPKPLFIATNL